MQILLIIVFSLCLCTTTLAQSFPYDIFKPRTLQEMTLITTKTVRPDDSMVLATNLLESKMVVMFTGKSRPILDEHKTFISTWSGMLGHSKEYAELYQREYLYKEGNDEYWLPTQEPITKYFAKELKEGDKMTLYLISIGAYRNKGNIDCVFLIEEYQKQKEEPSEINIAPNAQSDKPIQATAEQIQKFEEAIKPYIQKAKETYSNAKERFLKGLPTRQTFFITTRLKDQQGRFEQVFIAVKEIKNGIVTGLIASDIQVVSGYKKNDSYSFAESELIDWTISKPDGTEEGNFVGKLLDTYQP